MSEFLNTSTLLSLLCIVGLVVVLGGGIAIMLYGWRELVAMGRSWLDGK